MKKTLKISSLFRKRVAELLIINFLFSTILFAFPNEQCDDMCGLDQKVDQCSDMPEMSCCDMMGNENNTSKDVGLNLTENSCDYEYIFGDSFPFIIPKIVDSKIVLSEISIVQDNVKQDISYSLNFYHDNYSDIKPPIYLTISSFLI